VPAEYGKTYTRQELAAIDQALHAINCTRQDMTFEKDYAKGYDCLPVVKQMLHDPLAIAPYIDKLAGGMRPQDGQPMLDSAWRTAAAQIGDSDLSPQGGLWGANDAGDWEPYPTAHYTPAQVGFIRDIVHILAQPAIGGPQAASEPEFRDAFKDAMAWHPVDSKNPKAAADAENTPNKDIFALADKLDWYEPGKKVLAQLVDFTNQLKARQDLATLFPQDKPLIVDTSWGRICLGTPHDDTYSGDFAVLIDPGGNDTYHNCRIGAAYGARTHAARLGPDGLPTGMSADWSPLGDGRIGYFCDLGGDDTYDCADTDVTLGAAVLGVGACFDLGQGNDRYYAGSCSLGAAMGGIGLFYDDGGSDTYSGKVFTQGAAGYGIGLMLDDSLEPAPVVPTDVETPEPIVIGGFDNDVYTAWSEAQAFSRTRGIAVCANRRGNDIYQAGGVYLDAPLFTDRYESFSQGFAIGERDIDYAGGIALLADFGGNDLYLGDIYNQGVGYWYSAGLLYDGGGNDTYEMTQYGQGSGIHLAVGGLVDDGGHDTYVMHSGLGQGSSHDFATSILFDRGGGNDKYYGTTTNCGASLTNSACLFIDDGGNDIYAAAKDGGLNYGRPARDAGSIGLFVDMEGDDSYLGKYDNDAQWTNSQYGTGIDTAPPPSKEVTHLSAGGLAEPSDKTVIPDIVSYQGPLTQEVFDKLWEIAIRWEVGDNRAIVPKARERLVAFGPDVLPYVEKKMDDPNSLAIRGYDEVFKAFAFKPEPPAGDKEKAAGTQPTAVPPQPADTLPLVTALLSRQLASGDAQRELSALVVASDLGLPQVGDSVAKLLDDPDMAMQRRALGTLGALGSHSADARVLALLQPGTDERLLKTAIGTAAALKLDCYPQFRALLDVPKFTARDELAGQLAAHYAAYGAGLKQDFLNPDGLGLVAQRTLLRAYLNAPDAPDAALLRGLPRYLASADWGMRSDAAALAEHWRPLVKADAALSALYAGDGGLDSAIAAAKAHAGEPWPARN
jgi:hypothetical protein